MPYYERLLSLLGFTKIKAHIWTDNEGFYFQFNQAKTGTSDYERYGVGMNHLGFAAPSVEFVENIQAQMRAAGFDVPKIQSFDGVKACFMKDPDGIRFEISYYPPGVAAVS
tara:strand:- start:137 stop:469 length:333 start_codon:yes stop_codon:yes gene_type:complete